MHPYPWTDPSPPKTRKKKAHRGTKKPTATGEEKKEKSETVERNRERDRTGGRETSEDRDSR